MLNENKKIKLHLLRVTERVYFLILFVHLVCNVQAQKRIALVGGTVIPVEKSSTPFKGTILIHGSKVSQILIGEKPKIPADFQIIDVSGKYIIPGLIDGHAHVSSREQRAILSHWGITAILNPNSSLSDISNENHMQPEYDDTIARVLATGPLLGSGAFKAFGAMVVEQLDDVHNSISTLKSAGILAVKLMYDDLGYILPPLEMMNPELMRAVIQEAHQSGLKVFVHALNLENAKEVLKAGADAILHSVVSDTIDEEFINLMLRNKAFYVPTFSVFEASADIAMWGGRLKEIDITPAIQPLYDSLLNPATMKQFRSIYSNTYLLADRLPVIRDNLKRVSEARIPIVMGTDTNAPGVLPGVSSIMELILEVENGLSPLGALQTATINAAKALGLSDFYGSIAPGKIADIVVLNRNPLSNIRALTDINMVILGGRVLRR